MSLARAIAYKIDQAELQVLGAKSAMVTAKYPEKLDIMSISDALQAIFSSDFEPKWAIMTFLHLYAIALTSIHFGHCRSEQAVDNSKQAAQLDRDLRWSSLKVVLRVMIKYGTQKLVENTNANI